MRKNAKQKKKLLRLCSLAFIAAAELNSWSLHHQQNTTCCLVPPWKRTERAVRTEPQRPWGAGGVGKVSRTTRGPNIWCFLHMQASISHPHSESSARTCSRRHLLKKCKIYQPRNARVHHVLSLWTLILALCVARNCSLLVHTPFYITRGDILRPVQPQKVTRAACSGHT